MIVQAKYPPIGREGLGTAATESGSIRSSLNDLLRGVASGFSLIAFNAAQKLSMIMARGMRVHPVALIFSVLLLGGR